MKNFIIDYGQCVFSLLPQKRKLPQRNKRGGQPPFFKNELVTHFIPSRWGKMGHLPFFEKYQPLLDSK